MTETNEAQKSTHEDIQAVERAYQFCNQILNFCKTNGVEYTANYREKRFQGEKNITWKERKSYDAFLGQDEVIKVPIYDKVLFVPGNPNAYKLDTFTYRVAGQPINIEQELIGQWTITDLGSGQIGLKIKGDRHSNGDYYIISKDGIKKAKTVRLGNFVSAGQGLIVSPGYELSNTEFHDLKTPDDTLKAELKKIMKFLAILS